MQTEGPMQKEGPMQTNLKQGKGPERLWNEMDRRIDENALQRKGARTESRRDLSARIRDGLKHMGILPD